MGLEVYFVQILLHIYDAVIIIFLVINMDLEENVLHMLWWPNKNQYFLRRTDFTIYESSFIPQM